MQKASFIEQFETARNKSAPLIAIETADPAATMRRIRMNYKDVPIVSWDLADGLKAWTKKGEEVLPGILGKRQPNAMTNPVETISAMKQLPDDSILFMVNCHRIIGNDNEKQAAVGQAIWNVRDSFKGNFRTLVLLGPAFMLPPELKQDVLVLDHPLPTKEEIKKIIDKVYDDADAALVEKKMPKLTRLSVKQLAKTIETLRGLSAFSIEQTMSLSLTKDGLNSETLWLKKKVQVEQTPGLKIYSGSTSYKDVTGIEPFKQFMTDLFNGEDPPNHIVFLDEMEKMFAGASGGDLSGTSQEQLGEFLRWMQDNNVLGIILVGHPGCSKTYVIQASANEFDLPMVEMNMTALKGSLVGSTGLMTRNALKMSTAMGRPLVAATSNSLGILPPELKRRFQMGTWFFDLPLKEERDACWNLYLDKYGLKDTKIPADNGWTPFEIKTCCDLAWRLKRSIVDASKLVVPVVRSAPERIEQLRKDADSRFLDASKGGTYKYITQDYSAEPSRSLKMVD